MKRKALGAALFVGIALAAVFVGCTQGLPGPIECERMAVSTLGDAPQRVRQSPAARRWVAKLVNGCLTTPFDHDAVRCLEERRNLPSCMDEMVLRAPERKEAVVKLLESARQHHVR